MTSTVPLHPPRPPGLVLAAAVLVLQALAALVLAVLEIAQTNTARAVVGVGAGILLATYAVGLAALAWGAWLARRWCRGPAIALQLILLPLAWSFRGGSTTWVFWVLSLAAAGVLVGLLAPRSTRALVGGGDQGPGRPGG